MKMTMLASILVCGSSAFAAEVSVSKLRVNLDVNQTADFLSVLNQSDTKKESFEIKLFKWSQKENLKKEDGTYGVPEEVLEESNDIILSPKTIVVLPKQDKVLRILLNNNEEAKKNYSYRMVINQLPSKDSDGEQNVVNLLFKISLPIFVYNEKIKKIEDMSVNTRYYKEGKNNILEIKNNDKQHVQVQNIVYGKERLSVNHYLLPGNITKINVPESFSEKVYNEEFVIETDKGNIKNKELKK